MGACDSLSVPTTTNTPTLIPRMTIVDSATLAPTPTPRAFPSVTPHIFCDDAPESFLILGERARVTDTGDDETLNLRSGPSVDYNVLQRIQPLQVFFVLDGPQCAGGYTWFKINYKGQVGWIAEGDNDQYYAEPFLTG